MIICVVKKVIKRRTFYTGALLSLLLLNNEREPLESSVNRGTWGSHARYSPHPYPCTTLPHDDTTQDTASKPYIPLQKILPY